MMGIVEDKGRTRIRRKSEAHNPSHARWWQRLLARAADLLARLRKSH